jgi:hypothetical protein
MNPLDKLIGTWSTEATHPDMPGVVVHGSAVVEWLEGHRFLMHRAWTDHPDFPDALVVIGHMDEDRVDDATKKISGQESPLRLHYFDSRGVFRVFETSIDDTSWKFSRIVKGFSQRFTGTFADEGHTIVGQTQLRRDDVHWKDDLAITYRRKRY